MAEQTFRSPGFFEREIDLTQRTTEIVGTPAGVIGTSIKGPAFVPVTVGSFADFESKFGSLDPDRFGPYAANEWLKNRTALTYIRVLGAGANATTSEISLTQTAGIVKNAGFRLSGSRAEASEDSRYNGTVQFLTAIHTQGTNEAAGYPVLTDNSSVTSTGDMHFVRSMILTATGSRVMVLDHDQSYSTSNVSDDIATISAYDGSSGAGTFKIVLSSSMGSLYGNDEGQAGLRIYTASLDPASQHFVGKILNTNPDRFGTEQHLLYADFPIESELAKVKTSAGSVGITSGSDAQVQSGGLLGSPFTELYGRFDTRYRPSRSTSFISQPFGDTEYDLFHFESIDDGVAGNRRVKISISNLRRSTDPKNPYGTFTVLVRDYTDTDTDMKILEQYPLCTLNPGDDDYVGTKIGDFKAVFNFDAETESERRVNVSGKRPNRSSFVRIVMNAAVEDGEVPADALPFGFRGLPLIKTTTSLTDSTSTLAGGSDHASTLRLGCVGSSALQRSILPPVPLRFKASRGAVNSSPSFTGDPGILELADSRLFFGVKFETVPSSKDITNPVLQSNASGKRNKLLDSYSKFLGVEKSDLLLSGSSVDLFNDNKFTLSRVAFFNQPASATQNLDDAVSLQNQITGSVSAHMVEAAYIRNGKVQKPRYTIKDGALDRLTFASLAAAKSATAFNKFTEYMKFTNMMYGGFDGLNILDRDQRLMNDKSSDVASGGKATGGAAGYENLPAVSSPGAGKENNIVSSYRTAISILTDPFASRVNIVTLPGLRSSFITDHAMEKTKEYSQAIYLMDIPPFSDDLTRLYDGASTRPNVRKTAEQFEGRALDSNYSAVYFPDVIINDEVNGDAVNVPASVAALGALGFNDRVAFPWFAPAGFNRGALDSVLNTEVRLNAEDRNVLYETRINPIASFPDGGFVIFGQKTLQQAKSALDRVNVRRMLLEVKRIVSDIANGLIFEQNTPVTRQRFIDSTKPRLARIQSNQGIDSFRVIMDSSNNTAEDAEQNRLNGRIVLVPTRAAEFIAIDFIITNSGVSFE
tara:strand:- start:2122 stop:5235 length:3114 start_codon:yes stop_codon:yes gene_type:complete